MPAVQDAFLPFLPQDEAGGADPAAEEVVQLIAHDLGQLLAAPDAAFWTTVRGSASLQTCLDSYLQNCRRPHDEGQDGAPPSAARQQLSRNVFMVLLRMAQGAAQRPENGAALARRGLLNVPKLLDVAVLYGEANPALTQQLISQAFAALPGATPDLQAMAVTTQRNLADVCETCCGRVQGAAALPEAVLEGLTDGVVYLRDACLTLGAFLAAAPAAGPLLMAPDNGGLLAALGPVHDELVPALSEAAKRPKTPAQPAAQMLRLLGHLQLAAQQAGAQLLRHACLAAHVPLPSGKTAGAGLTAAVAVDPVSRGELLLSALIALGQGSGAGAGGSAGFLTAISARLQLPAAIPAAAAEGVLQLDAAQRDYLSALLGSPLPEPAMAAAAGGAAAGSAGASSAGAGPSRMDPELASQIAQIRDVLPDYGDGFLTAALQHSGGRPDRVIDTLLEGSLPPELLSLDPHSAAMPRPQPPAAASAPTASRGSAAGASGGMASWEGLAADSAALTAAGAPASRAAPAASLAVPLRRPHKATARALDRRAGAERDAIRAAAEAAQWEYEDEYDDSFDAYDGGNGADGMADAEGDEDEARVGSGRYFGSQGRGGSGGNYGPPPPRGAFGSQGSGGAMPASQQQHPQPQQPQQGRGRGRGGQQQARSWVLDGRVYNYKKEGATEVAGGPEAAQRDATAARAAAQAIHGLGPGGNVPLAPPRGPLAPPLQRQRQQPDAQRQPDGAGAADGMPGGAAEAAGRSDGGGHGRGRDGGGSDSGGGRGRAGRGGAGGSVGASANPQRDHARKDKNKAAVGNHHRKDRAARKTGMF